MIELSPNQGAGANRRPAGQSDGSDNLRATVTTGRAFLAAVAQLGQMEQQCRGTAQRMLGR